MKTFSSSLDLQSDGIWHSERVSPVSFPDDGHDENFALEDVSFWMQHRNDCIVSLVREFPPKDGGTIFDVGGGNGFVSRALAQNGFRVALVEPGIRGALNAKARGIPDVICATLEDACFEPKSLPAIGLFDVVEHIENDRAFLALLHELLADQGMVYATVPAYSWLWSNEDDAAGHFRRYTLHSMCDVLAATGFRVLFATYIFRFLPLPIFLMRSLPSRLGIRNGEDSERSQREHEPGSRLVRSLVDRAFAPEVARIEKRRPISFGGSCLVAATRA